MDWLMKTIRVPSVTVASAIQRYATDPWSAATPCGVAPLRVGQRRGRHSKKFNVNVRVMNQLRPIRPGPGRTRRTATPPSWWKPGGRESLRRGRHVERQTDRSGSLMAATSGGRRPDARRCPDRGRRPVRHRCRPTTSRPVSVGRLRDLRGPRRHRRDVGPLPLPRHPLRFGHAHAGLFVPAVGRREVDRRRRLHSAVHQGHGQRVGHRRPHSLQPPHHRGRVVDAGVALARHGGADRHQRDDRAHGIVPLLLQRLLPLRPRVPARLRGHGRLRRHHRAPAGLARGPRRRREDDRGHRQRGDRRHAGPRAGAVGRPRHHAAAVADLHRLPAGEEPRRGAVAQGPAGEAGRDCRQVVPRLP